MNTMKRRLLILFIPLLICCTDPTQTQEAWGWYTTPTIAFLSKNWQYTANQYSSGDSLSFALAALSMYLDSNRMALLVSASGDSEEVNFFSGQVPIPLPFSIPAIYSTLGKRFPSKAADVVQSWNGVLEVKTSEETVSISYLLSDPQSTLLTDSVLIRR